MNENESIEQRDFLQSNNFLFTIDHLPETSFYCQRATIPGIILADVKLPAPAALAKLSIPGNRVEFSPLNITFTVDEEMKNYLEIHDWIISHGAPESVMDYEQLLSDATLLITTNLLNTQKAVIYKNIHPTEIGDLEFTTSEGQNTPLQANATFAYDTYEIRDVA